MKLENRLVLFLIMLAAVLLRFYNLFEIPLTHDEFSAIFRTRFDSFSELIQNGVMKDGHPAGVQVFLYYWIKLFGEVDWIIKLPFLLSGVASVYLVFLIGKMWFNETVGLISATLISSAQFTVMYSQIARPYASGLFLSLFMVYFWSRVILKPNKKYNQNLIGFIFFAACCAYNHYFSLLFAFIVGLSGLFFIQKKFLVKYLFSGLAIFVLFLPHLNIFRTHLDISGLTWLGKPNNDFIIKYLGFGLNYSILSYLLISGLAILGLFNWKKARHKKLSLLALSWFALPFIIGFFYSIYRTPILQYSVLIFSFPFLFIGLFGLLKNLQPKWNLIIVSVLLLVNLNALIYDRDHYSVFYNSCFEYTLKDYQEVQKSYKGMLSAIIDLDDEISPIYMERLGIEGDFKDFNQFESTSELKRYITNLGGVRFLYFSEMYDADPAAVSVIRDLFPNVMWQRNYQGATTYLFSRVGTNDHKNVVSNVSFTNPTIANWTDHKPENLETDGSGNVWLKVDETIEYPKTYQVPLHQIISTKNQFIEYSIDLNIDESNSEVILYASLSHDGKIIYERGESSNNLIKEPLFKSGWQKMYESFMIKEEFFEMDELELKIFVWNKGKSNFEMDNFRISTRKGNPILYGHIEDF